MPEKKEGQERPRQLSVVSHLPLAAKAEEPETMEVPVYTQSLDSLSMVEQMRLSLARRLVSYGILSLIFGCSIALGFTLCMAFLR
jgi:hypothetical protein